MFLTIVCCVFIYVSASTTSVITQFTLLFPVIEREKCGSEQERKNSNKSTVGKFPKFNLFALPAPTLTFFLRHYALLVRGYAG